jgi:hypothetical protein
MIPHPIHDVWMRILGFCSDLTVLKESSLVCAPWRSALRPRLFSQVLWKGTALTIEDMQILQLISNLAQRLRVTMQVGQVMDQDQLLTSILITLQHLTKLELDALYFPKFASLRGHLQLVGLSLNNLALVDCSMGVVEAEFLDDDEDSGSGACPIFSESRWERRQMELLLGGSYVACSETYP